ncbi:alpha/beta hydrolase family protein [Nocardia sp. NPDC058176]|uniref:alpha/beta hydrolase family protein n=1 Tax=Nocardia sp. NPDC058176 TaxID=3346368 RepID=UPI0036D7650F
MTGAEPVTSENRFVALLLAHANASRNILRCLAALILALTGTGIAAAEPLSPHIAPVVVTLPAPTGDHAIGVVDLHLVDAERRDPYVPAQQRELMISIWYPAADTSAAPVRPWMATDIARIYAEDLASVGVPSADSWALAPSRGRLDAPADISRGARPIVLFSPGMGLSRELSTAQAEDLASHGYVVVTMNHTHETFATEFPDGRIARSVLPPAAEPDEVEKQVAIALPTRVADTRFVLDALADLAAGANPDAGRHPLPAQLADVLDLSKVAMYGHSLGGATAAQAMYEDRRIGAAANLDGGLWGPVVSAGLDRPFLLISAEGHHRDDIPSWKQFWSTAGPKLHFQLRGAQHHSFCDNQILADALAAAGLLPAAGKVQLVGEIDPERSLEVQRGYLRTFFDTTLGGNADPAHALAMALSPEMTPVP